MGLACHPHLDAPWANLLISFILLRNVLASDAIRSGGTCDICSMMAADGDMFNIDVGQFISVLSAACVKGLSVSVCECVSLISW